MAAACRAADMGRSVIVLEKTSHTGGNAQHAEGAAVYANKTQARAGIKFDRDALIAQKAAAYADTRLDRSLLTTLIDRGHEFYDWAEDHGFLWETWEVFGVPRLTWQPSILVGKRTQAWELSSLNVQTSYRLAPQVRR